MEFGSTRRKFRSGCSRGLDAARFDVRNPCVFALLLFWMTLGMHGNVHADDWTVSPALSQRLGYDTNLTLSAQPQGTWAYYLMPQLHALRKTQRMENSFTGQANIQRFTDLVGRDSENFDLTLNNTYFLQRGQLTLGARHAQQSTLSTQTFDTGALGVQSESITTSVSPGFSWNLTPIDTLAWTGNYNETEYTTTTFAGNQTWSMNLSETHEFSNRLKGVGETFFSHSIFSGDQSSVSDTYGFQVGGDYDITAKWSVSGRAGLRWVEGNGATTGTQSGNPVMGNLFNFSVRYHGQRNDWSIYANRSVNPSASGQISEYDSLGASWNHSLTERLSLRANGSMSQSASADSGQNANRETSQVSLDLDYALAKEWHINLQASHRQQTLGTGGSEVDSNALMLTVDYSPIGFRF